MAQLLVRNVDDAVVKKLRLKAAKEGVSVEEEHRRILRQALTPKSSPSKMNFKEFLLSMPNVGTDADFNRKRSMSRKVNF